MNAAWGTRSVDGSKVILMPELASASAEQFLPALPALDPLDFLRPPLFGNGASRAAAAIFPFDRPGWQPFFFGRNAVWHAMKLFGIGPGDRVLMPIYNHGVEVEAVLAVGAKIDFFRINEDLSADGDDIRSKIQPRTSVLYIIHYIGFPQPIEQLASIAREAGLRLVEDCALALFSSADGKWLGSTGDAAIFSLHKTLPVPNGGGLLVNDPAIRERAETISPPLATTMSRTIGSALDRLRLKLPVAGAIVSATARSIGRGVIDHAKIGRTPVGDDVFDQRKASWGMSGISQFVIERSDVSAIIQTRRRNFLLLAEMLGDRAWIRDLADGVCPLFFPLWVEEKESVAGQLAQFGIEAVNFWLLPHPSVPAGDSIADALRRHVIEIPCHQDLGPEQIRYVARILLERVLR